MIARSLIAQLVEQENLNFPLTNRIPRRRATRFMGWFSRIEQPLVRDLSIAVWRLFSDLDLSEARKTQFTSMHDCFNRELRDGVRPIDPDPAVLASPCDAIIGASGAIAADELLQIKGFSYTLRELFGECDLVPIYRGGRSATLRLTSDMYHRFRAPHDCRVEFGHTHPRRHLECQSGGAQTDRQAGLQERANSAAYAADDLPWRRPRA